MRPGTASIAVTTLLAAACAAQAEAPTEPPQLAGTIYETAASSYGIAPTMLYGVTLQETQRMRSPNRVSPWPWALRTPDGGQWFESHAAAAAALEQAVDRWSPYQIDVGLGQVNLGWHEERYDSPTELLDPQRNLQVSAAILAEALASTNDPALGVGRYHTWSDEERARRYGSSVLSIIHRISLLGRQ